MHNTIVDDYLWTFEFSDIDNQKLYKTCQHVEWWLQKVLPPAPKDLGTYGNFCSYYHRDYNLFLFPCPELYKLYNNLSTYFGEVVRDELFYIRCWVNLLKPGAKIGWHGHWPAKDKTYHGFYCVNTEGPVKSYTQYMVPGQKEVITIDSKDGLCILGKSEDDQHRSSVWENDGKRVTIAFDLIPVSTLRPEERFTHHFLNNYIPLNIIR